MMWEDDARLCRTRYFNDLHYKLCKNIAGHLSPVFLHYDARAAASLRHLWEAAKLSSPLSPAPCKVMFFGFPVHHLAWCSAGRCIYVAHEACLPVFQAHREKM